MIAVGLLLGLCTIGGCKREQQAPPSTKADEAAPVQPPWLGSEAATAEVLRPVATNVEPADGAVVAGGEAWLRWRSNMAASARVLWRRAGNSEFKAIDAGSGEEFLLRIAELEPGTKYEYQIELTAGELTERNELRTISVQDGLAFDRPVIDQVIPRDYDQHLTLTLHNRTAQPVVVAAKALKTFDELPADIVGPGSADQPAKLPPGDALHLRLALNAADARRGTYEIPVEAAGAAAMVRVRIAQPKVELAFRVIKRDPQTLAQTIEIRNKGDGVTDLAVRIASANASDVRIQPDVHHAYLMTGQALRVVAEPLLYLEFAGLSAELECEAAGQTARFALDFEVPAGLELTGFRTATQERTGNSDWYCTNKPSTCSHVSGAGANGPEAESWRKMSFGDAAEPYAKSDYTYNLDGYVDKKGNVRNGGLACSQYASAVLHRMKYGKDWLNDYSLSVHQWYGDKIAEHFGLKLSNSITAATLLDQKATKQLIDDCQLAPGLYFFNLRKGVGGHVGFVRVNADGSLTQSHYSGLNPWNGIASGDFRSWFGKSKYSKSDLELYSIPE